MPGSSKTAEARQAHTEIVMLSDGTISIFRSDFEPVPEGLLCVRGYGDSKSSAMAVASIRAIGEVGRRYPAEDHGFTIGEPSRARDEFKREVYLFPVQVYRIKSLH